MRPGEERRRRRRISVGVRGKWRPVELDPDQFSQEGLRDVVCFEELSSYRLVDGGKERKRRRKGEREAEEEEAEPVRKKKKKKKNRNRTGEAAAGRGSGEAATQDGGGEQTAVKKKKKKQQVGDAAAGRGNSSEDGQQEGRVAGQEDEEETAADTEKNRKRSKSRQPTEKQPSVRPPEEARRGPDARKAPRKPVRNWTDAALSGSAEQNCDVSAWKELLVPPAVLKALSRLGFAAPTPIQALALPPAIRDRMDVLGAAETGSGKTLAFGIPMIHTILEWKNGSDGTTDPGRTEEPGAGGRQDDGGAEAPEEDEETGADRGGPEEDERPGRVRAAEGRSRPLLGLVLTPTRELAVQVKHHIDAVARFTDIQTAIVVGGMAQEKQRRVLKRRPEIVIATPGRLWDLIQERHPHLLNLRQLKCLVIDEADRMVERGHFAELQSLLEMLNTTHSNPTRQTFVFSATLTLVHALPGRVLQKKKKKKQQQLDGRSRLQVLMETAGIRPKPKVIDLTRKEATAESLTETQICCQKDEKDFYLYYFLLRYPGRTMVFANSIDCIKRLVALLLVLDRSPLPLHANMHQRQRLKNLERFADGQNCVLLTTDVAARGLDVPDVQHVIHYQVPRTSETYVHRSGRTARAAKQGLSLLLVGPDDVMNFRKISKTLGKEAELPVFPVEDRCMEAIKERVNLARKIEKIEFYNSREKQHDSWFRQAAAALEVDLDHDLLMGGAREPEADREQQRMVKELKKQLKRLVSQPMFKNAAKTKYPTQMGTLALANMAAAGTESALTRVAGQKTPTQKLQRYFPQKKRLKKRA